MDNSAPNTVTDPMVDFDRQFDERRGHNPIEKLGEKENNHFRDSVYIKMKPK